MLSFGRAKMLIRVIAAAMMLLSLSSAKANATLFNITYTGVVTEGSEDQTAVFGRIDTSGLAYLGMSYSATYLVDSSLGATTFFTAAGRTVSGTSPDDPVLLMTITINGHTVVMPSTDATILSYNDGNRMALQLEAVNLIEDNGPVVFFQHLINDAVSNTVEPLGFQPPLGDITHIDSSFPGAAGNMTFFFGVFLGADQIVDTKILGSFESLTVSEAVPEPSSWAMLVIGFAGLRAMAHRRRKALMAGS
jgi:hypothetical protein